MRSRFWPTVRDAREMSASSWAMGSRARSKISTDSPRFWRVTVSRSGASTSPAISSVRAAAVWRASKTSSRMLGRPTLPELFAQIEPLLREALPRLAGRPQLYIAAERDMMVSLSSARALYDAAPEPKAFVTIASDHTFAGENARGSVLAWLNERHPRAERSVA